MDNKGSVVPWSRKLRGFFRYFVLYALKDGPSHGYALMRRISEITGIDYIPSSGVLYPTLHALEREGLVRSRVEGRRKVYELTEKGRRELELKREEIEKWFERARKAHEMAKRMGLYRILNIVAFIFEKGIDVPEEVLNSISKHLSEIERLLMEAVEKAGYEVKRSGKDLG